MSWNIFSRFTSNAPKKTVLSKEEEAEFNREVTKIEVLDDATKRLYKDLKKSMEAMATLSKHQCRIGHNLAASPVLNTEPDLKSLEMISKSVGQIEEHTHELNSQTTKVMVEPMKKFTLIFPNIYLTLKKREQCLQEYTRCQVKVEKYEDKERTGQNLAKLTTVAKKSLETAKESFEKINSELMKELPDFFEGRLDYFQPCFEALIKSQIEYYTKCFKIYAELAPELEYRETVISDEDFEDQIQQKMADIRALSIVVDD
ncbi:Bridging integrator 3-like [Holothuria leucospilota]|uniref:Bridging integrator 3-like n=1 Tax=Holothuria leucospilota TaxID=206669 RepID=A0A9Q0YN58_HOLLE|nr:Bridging integrator 3-like [Holothuria leucospilota]